MKNIDLNAGGLIGALVCGGIAAAVVLSNLDPADKDRGPYKFIIFAIVGGALAGNFLWGLVFKKREQGPESSYPERTDSGTSVVQEDPKRGAAGRRSSEVDNTHKHRGGPPV